MNGEGLERFPPVPMEDSGDMAQYVPSDAQIGEAMLWLARRRETGSDGGRAFERWMSAHPAHAFAYAEAEGLFAFSAAPAKAAARHYHRHGTDGRRGSRGLRRWRFAGSAIAAGFALLLLTPALDAVHYVGADAVASAGRTKTVKLADNSRITLNTRTAIDLDFSAGRRGVRLRGGEAYFEVAKDPKHPFRIRAGDTRIEVLGTKFNVRMDGDQVLVGVTEGRVMVTGPASGDHPSFVTAGQELIVDPYGMQKRILDSFGTLAWRRHELVVRRTPLRVIVQELNRYRTANIYVLNNALGESRFSGVFRTDDPVDAVRTIERALKIRAFELPTGQTFFY